MLPEYPRPSGSPPRRPADRGLLALLVLQAGATAVVLAALPYPLFQLDRYTFPKELVLCVAALAAALLCLASARRLTRVHGGRAAGRATSVCRRSRRCSRPTAGWPFRALGVSLAGAALFWCARTVARAGRGGAAARGASRRRSCSVRSPGLVQAYGLVETNLASLTRAPGGTFGNRNFMAHLVAIGLPVLLYVALEAALADAFALRARSASCSRSAALVLSRVARRVARRRACSLFLVVEGLWMGRLWDGPAAPPPRSPPRRPWRLAGLAPRAGPAQPAQLAIGLALSRLADGRRQLQGGQRRGTADPVRQHPRHGRRPSAARRRSGQLAGVLSPLHVARAIPRSTPTTSSRPTPGPAATGWRRSPSGGFVARCCLGLVGAAIALGAWARVRRGSR